MFHTLHGDEVIIRLSLSPNTNTSGGISASTNAVSPISITDPRNNQKLSTFLGSWNGTVLIQASSITILNCIEQDIDYILNYYTNGLIQCCY